MATFTTTDLTTAFVGAAEVYKKSLLAWDIRSVGVQVRTNVNTPQAMAKFTTDGTPQPYRKQDDFNGATFTDRVLTAYQAKYDQELDAEDLRNTYLAELPEMPFEQYAMQQGGDQFLDAIMRNVLWSGVRNGAGTAVADICDGWGTIIAAEITATNITEVATGAITTANAVTKEVGIATITIKEFLKLLRNKSITNDTNRTAKIKSKTTEFTAAIVLSVLSSAIINFTPELAFCCSID